ncbi:MAG: CotH kinase family protein [Desulfobacterales bacterium]
MDGKSTKVRIRLKGDITDHLKGEKWSLRVKVKGKDAIWGMRRFSLQAPERSGWGHEWVMYAWFKKEGLISLRYDYVELIINGKNMGIYTLEESFSKELIENNQRREGPILKWDESLLFDHEKASRGDMLDENDLFYAADVTSFTTKKLFTNESLRNNFLMGRNMLTALRSGQVKFSDVFDVERAAKTLAILDISNALHALRWKNCRFYFNPITNKLELIAYNAYTESPIVPIKENPVPLYAAHHQKLIRGGVYEWLDLFLSDKEFVKHYFAALDRFTSPGYLESFFHDISSDMERIQNAIFKDYPSRSIWIPVYLHNRDVLRSLLYPKLPLKAYLNQYDGKKIRLSVANPMFLPAVIDGIELTKSGQFFGNPTPPELQGKIVGQPLRYIGVEVPAVGIGQSILSKIRDGDALVLDGIRIKYHLPGIKAYRLARIDAHALSFSKLFIPHEENTQHLQELKHKGMLSIDDQRREVSIKSGDWTIENDLVIPEGFKTIVHSGSQIILNKDAAIICYGPVEMVGTEKVPVVLKSTDGTGQGLAVISANRPSQISNVVFDNLKCVSRNNWKLTGAVTFYESNLEMDRVEFLNNHSEDQLNIVRSNFNIRNSKFNNSYHDALDVDFGEGSITESIFESCGNDCLDFAGSKAEIRKIRISSAGDKGMSIGEKSLVRVFDSSVSRSKIALSSKDMSTAVAEKLHISDSKIGFAAYQKKPEYGGAQIYAKEIVMKNVADKYVGDKQSQIVENGKEIKTSFSNNLIN